MSTCGPSPEQRAERRIAGDGGDERAVCGEEEEPVEEREQEPLRSRRAGEGRGRAGGW